MTDALDFADVQIHSSPDVRAWPITSEITELGLRPSTLHIRHTKEGVWPPVPYETTTQQATLWVFVKIDGKWHGTGAERIRPQQTDKPEPDRVSQWVKEWLYNPQMWGPMANYLPQPGELVGFMLTAGIQRVGDSAIIRERTSIVLVPYPDDRGATFPPFASLHPPQPAEPPSPPPAPVDNTTPAAPPTPTTPEVPAAAALALFAKLDAIHDAIVKQSAQQQEDAKALRDAISRLVGH